MIKTRNSLALCFLTITYLSCAQNNQKEIPTSLSTILTDPCFHHAGLGLAVYDLSNSTYQFVSNPDLALPPASTLKIWTTAAALDQLGADFRFTTEIGYVGKIHGDTLSGDLIIKGSGDPSLASSQFSTNALQALLDSIYQIVRTADINVIKGSIVGDASFYPKDLLPRTWPYQDLGNYYGSHTTGLNVFDNLFEIHFQQNLRRGQSVKVLRTRPMIPSLQIDSYVTTGEQGSGDQAYVMGAPFQEKRMIIGTIPPGSGQFKIKGSLPDPALFLAHHLHEDLEKKGIPVMNGFGSTYKSSKDLQLLGSLESKPLHTLAELTNKKSINLFAEGIGQRMATSQMEKAGVHPLQAYWEGKEINLGGCRISDFAGLAPDNAITARSMVEVLAYIYKYPERYPKFEQTLARSGMSGTLVNMWRSSPARGQILAKSGSINGVLSYAGYIDARSGRKLAFCVLTQNADCKVGSIRKKLEELLEILYLFF